MPLPNLALDLAAFGDDVQLARQLLRQAFPVPCQHRVDQAGPVSSS